jgi:hypothetical protein
VIKFPKRAAVLVASVLAFLGVSAGIAYAAIPEANGQFHGCVGQVGGYLRVIDPAAGSCISTETPVAWGSGFTDWKIVSGDTDIPTGANDISASCDYANGYRLVSAVAQQPSNGSPFQLGVAPIRLLAQVSGDNRPTGATWHVTPLASSSQLSWQLSCAK